MVQSIEFNEKIQHLNIDVVVVFRPERWKMEYSEMVTHAIVENIRLFSDLEHVGEDIFVARMIRFANWIRKLDVFFSIFLPFGN